jgi:cadmium resistance protein CadD (predicted permease)
MWAAAAKFVAKPAVKWIAGILGVVAIVVGVLWYLDSERSQARKDGAASVKTEVQTQTIIIQKAITDAENRGPRTRRDVSDRLRSGSF